MLQINKYDLYKNNQLRNIFIYKSKNFDNKKIPTLFLVHDGQNFFDEKYASYNMSWDIVSTLNKLDIDNYLIVGLESSPSFERLLELSPLKISNKVKNLNNQLQKGNYGEKYLSAINKNLLPSIADQFKLVNYKKIMIGSSMGGLITTYAALKYSELYDGFIAFSNALSVNEPDIYEFIQSNNKIGKYYTYMGGKESSESLIDNKIYIRDYQFMKDYLNKNYNSEQYNLHYDEQGEHNELTWKQALPQAIKWVMKGI